jgi:hypothetical protein
VCDISIKTDHCCKISQYLKKEVTIVKLSGVDSSTISKSTVGLNTSTYKAVISSIEMKLAVEKRFKRKTIIYEHSKFKEITAWCLTIDLYKVCAKNVRYVSNADIESAWEFIDTISVSSTETLRRIIQKSKKERSAVGFERKHTKHQFLRVARSPKQSVSPSS